MPPCREEGAPARTVRRPGGCPTPERRSPLQPGVLLIGSGRPAVLVVGHQAADAKVPDSLHALIEILAEEAHNNWARRRLSEGWRYGRRLSRRRETHSLLVPYCALTQAQQAADRVLTMGSVKVILRHGYTLQEPAGR